MKTSLNILAFALLLLLIAFAAFLRFPIVGDGFCDPDVAGVAYSSQELIAGGAMYDRCVETKPPASYMLFALLFHVFGLSMAPVYITAIIFHTIVLLSLFFIARSMLNPFAGVLAAFFYALYSVNVAANGLCPNFESWTLAPVSLSYALIWLHGKRDSYLQIALAGILAGMAVLFKQTALIFPLAGFVLIWINLGRVKGREERPFLFVLNSAVFLVGALLPVAGVMVFFALRGGLTPMLEALNPLYYIWYASSESTASVWDISKQRIGFFVERTPFLLLFTLFSFVIAVFLKVKDTRTTHRRGMLFVLIWLFAAVVNVCAGTKFFDHYFVVLFPPLALCASFAVVWPIAFGEIKKPIAALLVLCALGFAVVDSRLEISIAAHSAKKYLQTGTMEWTEQNPYYWTSSDLPRILSYSEMVAKIGRCINNKTNDSDLIYVWDYAPEIYYYARRRAPTRHFMYFEVANRLPEGSGRWYAQNTPKLIENQAELMTDLENRPPKYIVVYNINPDGKYEWHYLMIKKAPMFDALADYTTANYTIDTECTNVYITSYVRTPASE